jgi:hypothetical protein
MSCAKLLVEKKAKTNFGSALDAGELQLTFRRVNATFADECFRLDVRSGYCPIPSP